MSAWDAIAITVLSLWAGYGSFRAVWAYLNDLRAFIEPSTDSESL